MATKQEMLAELKALALLILQHQKDGHLSEHGELDKYPDAEILALAPMRRILTTDPAIRQHIIDTVTRFVEIRDHLIELSRKI